MGGQSGRPRRKSWLFIVMSQFEWCQTMLLAGALIGLFNPGDELLALRSTLYSYIMRPSRPPFSESEP